MQTFLSAFYLKAIIGAMHVISGMDTDHKHTYALHTTACANQQLQTCL
jgi:hypothetical protein